MIFRRSTELVFNSNVAQTLACDVYGFLPQTTISEPIKVAIFHHWETLKTLNPQFFDRHPQVDNIDNLCSVIKELKDQPNKTVQELHAHLATAATVPWITAKTSSAAIDDVLHFILRLWLFAKPDLSNKTITLQQAVQNSLNSIKRPSNLWLWEDFSATKLESTADIHFTYTHNLEEHLTFATWNNVKIFSNTKVLQRYAESPTPESQWYPAGMLDEFNRTMNLLLPVDQPKVRKRVGRIQKKHYADLEASMGQVKAFDLSTYPFFGERLAKLQERHEVETQRRMNGRNVRIAILGIFLTALFGLVSAATGLVSMWAGLRQVGKV